MRMYGHITLLAVVFLVGAWHPASADVLNMGGTRDPATGQWTGLASLETVPVGDAGNAADTRVMTTDGTTGYGAVGYDYRIGKYEVTAGQYCELLNKVAATDTYGLYDTNMWSDARGCKIERYAGDGTTGSPYQYRVAADYANRPVNFVSFWNSCRFANWLHNGQPSGAQDSSTTEDGAYTLTAQGMTNNTINRNGTWKWALPTEDEWYKAAYYKGGSTNAGYWLYPTGSNSVPGRDMNDASGNNANYNANGLPIDSGKYTTLVGEFQNSDSPYGTFDHGGNVWEWNEAVVSGSSRGLRGGSFYDNYGDFHDSLRAAGRNWYCPPFEYYFNGFRVVQVHEPTPMEFVTVGAPGNAGQLSGVGAGGYGPDRICGAVSYVYQIGKYEVTAGQYCEFLNAVARTDTYGLYNTSMWSSANGCKIQRSGSSGTCTYSVASDWANRPVNYLSWGDAARFANWLTNGQPTGLQDASTTEDGSYVLSGATSVADLLAVIRKTNAQYVIPSEDEWYKAAYYDPSKPGGAGYWDYPTRSNAHPSNLLSPTGTNNACFWNSSYSIGSPYYRTEVGAFAGSPSAYGTFDQGGNVYEFNEAIVFPESSRGLRGGFYRRLVHAGVDDDAFTLLASARDTVDPTYEGDGIGFRVAKAPVLGDINGDGGVDVVDLLHFVDAWGTQARSANWNAACDLNGDGYVDTRDRQIFLLAYGASTGQANYNAACDFNANGTVDSADNNTLQAANGAYVGDPNYNADCDFNQDGYVDVVDLLVLVENFGL